MAFYYLSSAGSDTAPYDTSAKAATTFANLTSGATIADFDTLYIVGTFEDTDRTAPALTNAVNITSAPGTIGKSTLVLSGTGAPIILMPTVELTEDVTISNLIIEDSHGASSFMQNGTLTGVGRIIFDDVEVYAENGPNWINADTSWKITIKNSIIKKTYGASWDYFLALSDDSIVTNNTFIINATQIASNSLGVLLADLAGTFDVHDNIFFCYSSSGTANTNPIYNGGGTGTFTYNTSNKHTLTGSTNLNNLDPMFVDASNNNFMLQTPSPAIRAGSNGGNIGWDTTTTRSQHSVGVTKIQDVYTAFSGGSFHQPSNMW